MTFVSSGKRTGMDNSIPEVREREGNGKNLIPKFRNRKGMKKNSIPEFGNGKWRLSFPGTGREWKENLDGPKWS